MNEHPFSWEHYRRIVSAGLKAGYCYVRFCDDADEKNLSLPNRPKRIYLRHDIENAIAAAHRMASIEHELGIISTYCVLLRSANYNPAEGRCIHMLHEMRDLGHDIGLHFSLLDHPDYDLVKDLEDLIQQDADILSRIIDSEVRMFSFHNPTSGGQFCIHVDGLINAYADCYFRDAYYTSDSNVRWHSGCPCQTLGNVGHDVIQILIHPNAFSGRFVGDRDVLLYYLGEKTKDLLAYNIGQSRVLRETGLSMTDVMDWIKKMGAMR